MVSNILLKVPDGTGKSCWLMQRFRLKAPWSLDLNVIAKLRPNLTLNMSYFTVDDGSPDIMTNAANRLTPSDAYTIGLSHFFPLGNGNVYSRIDYSYDNDYEFTCSTFSKCSMASRYT